MYRIEIEFSGRTLLSEIQGTFVKTHKTRCANGLEKHVRLEAPETEKFRFHRQFEMWFSKRKIFKHVYGLRQVTAVQPRFPYQPPCHGVYVDSVQVRVMSAMPVGVS